MYKFILFVYIFCLTSLLSAQTFKEVIDVNCGEMAMVSPLGYPAWNPAQITALPTDGHAILLGDLVAANLLQYTAPPCFRGRDTVIVACAKATQISCDTGMYIFNVQCPEAIETVVRHVVLCSDSIYVSDLSAWNIPMLITPAENGQAEIILEPTDGAGVLYIPNPGFEGLDAVKVTLNNGADTVLYTFQVYCDLTLKTEKPNVKRLNISPNPSNNILNFDFEKKPSSIVAYGMDGSKLDLQANFSSKQLDISSLKPGLYILEVRTNEAVFVGRFVKI